jgi:hypothetical protein
MKQVSYPTATLSGWFLPQQGGAIQLWVLTSVPLDQLSDAAPALLWEAGLLPYPYSQPLCLASLLLGASLAPLGGCLFFHPCSQLFLLFPPLFTESWAPCPTPILQGRFSIPPHPYCQCLCFSVLFSEGDSICPRAALDYVPRGWYGSHVWCMMLTCSFWRFPQAALEPAVRKKLCTTFLSPAGCRETFHGLEFLDVTEFNSDWCSVFCYWEKKREREMARGLSPRADTPCWLFHAGIFPAVSCSKKLF